MRVEMEKKPENENENHLSAPIPSLSSHLSLSQIIVDHCEVEAQLFHITLVTLEEEKVAIHLRVQWCQMVDIHICAGSQKFRQEKAGKG